MWVPILWLCSTWRQTEFPGRNYQLFDEWAETHLDATDEDRMTAWKNLVAGGSPQSDRQENLRRL